MKMILAISAATLITFAAYAAEPVAPPANNPSTSPPVTSPASPTTPSTTPAATDTAPGAVTMPASASPGLSCADMITKARGLTTPSDATKAKTVRDEIAAADAAGDDATCRSHAQNALKLMGGM